MRIFKALYIFISGIRNYVVSKFKNEFGDNNWINECRDKLNPDQKRIWNDVIDNNDSKDYDQAIDFSNLKIFSIVFKNIFKTEFDRKIKNLPTWFDDIIEVRNKCSHFQKLDKIEVDRSYSHMIIIMKKIGNEEIANQLESLQKAGNSPVKSPDEKAVEVNKDKTENNFSPNFTKIKHIPPGEKRTENGMKIGQYVQFTFHNLWKENLISPEELKKLQESSYSKTTFDANYPVLIPKNEKGLDKNSYNRYYKREIFCSGYKLSSQWYEYQRNKFLRWEKAIREQGKYR